MSSGFLRSGAIYAAANFLAAGVPFLLLPILTRALSPAAYGEVVSFFMIVPLCGALAGLSLHGAVGVRWLSQEKEDARGFTATAVALVGASTVVTATVAMLIGSLLEIGLSPFQWGLAALLSGAMTIQSIRFVVWQSRSQALPAATLQVAASVSNILLSLIGVLVLGAGADGRIAGAVIAGVLIATVSVLYLRREGIRDGLTAKAAKAQLRFGLPLLPHVAAGVLLTSADRFAVSAQLGSAALGIYGVASQIGLVMSVLADAATKAYTPSLYRQLGKDSLRGRLCIVGLTYLSIPFWLLLALAGWGVLLLCGEALLGKNYQPSLDLAIWFLLGGALNGIYLNVAALFFFTGRTEWISVSTVSAAILAMLLAPMATAYAGLRGAAAAYVLAQLFMLVLAWLLSLRVSPMPWRHPVAALRLFLRQTGFQANLSRRVPA